METKNSDSIIHPLQNINISNGSKYIIDVMHLFSLFTGWIFDLVRDFTISSKDSDEFYMKNINGYFDNIKEKTEKLAEIKSSIMFTENIIKNAEKRLKEIIMINDKKLPWLNENLLKKNKNNSYKISSFKGENTSIDNLPCYDKLTLLLSIVESLFIDSLYHPVIYSIIQVIRCLSTLYSFHDSDISEVYITNYRLCFYLDRITSMIPPKKLTPTIHRLSHVFSSLLCSGSLKIHDNFKMESQFIIGKNMMENLNSNPVTTVNNRIQTYTLCKIVMGVDDHTPFICRPNEIYENDHFNTILENVPLDMIILHCYLDDYLYMESGDSTRLTVLDVVPSFGNDYNTSEDKNRFSNSLKSILDHIGKTERNFKVTWQKILYKSIKIQYNKKNTQKYTSMSITVINQQQIIMHSLKDPIPSVKYPDYNKGLGYTLLANNTIQCFVIICYIIASVNDVNYSVAVCIPLDTEDVFLQSSHHRVTVKQQFNCDRVAFVSLNRLHVNESLISPSIKPDCFELMLLTLYLNQSKGVHGIKGNNIKSRYNLRKKTIEEYKNELKLAEIRIKDQQEYIKRLEIENAKLRKKTIQEL